MAQTKPVPVDETTGTLKFNSEESVLSVVVSVEFDLKRNLFQRKFVEILLLAQTTRSHRKMGIIKLDISDYLNQGLIEKTETRVFEKTFDNKSKLTFSIKISEPQNSNDTSGVSSNEEKKEEIETTPKPLDAIPVPVKAIQVPIYGDQNDPNLRVLKGSSSKKAIGKNRSPSPVLKAPIKVDFAQKARQRSPPRGKLESPSMTESIISENPSCVRRGCSPKREEDSKPVKSVVSKIAAKPMGRIKSRDNKQKSPERPNQQNLNQTGAMADLKASCLELKASNADLKTSNMELLKGVKELNGTNQALSRGLEDAEVRNIQLQRENESLKSKIGKLELKIEELLEETVQQQTNSWISTTNEDNLRMEMPPYSGEKTPRTKSIAFDWGSVLDLKEQLESLRGFLLNSSKSFKGMVEGGNEKIVEVLKMKQKDQMAQVEKAQASFLEMKAKRRQDASLMKEDILGLREAFEQSKSELKQEMGQAEAALKILVAKMKENESNLQVSQEKLKESEGKHSSINDQSPDFSQKILEQSQRMSEMARRDKEWVELCCDISSILKVKTHSKKSDGTNLDPKQMRSTILARIKELALSSELSTSSLEDEIRELKVRCQALKDQLEFQEVLREDEKLKLERKARFAEAHAESLNNILSENKKLIETYKETLAQSRASGSSREEEDEKSSPFFKMLTEQLNKSKQKIAGLQVLFSSFLLF